MLHNSTKYVNIILDYEGVEMSNKLAELIKIKREAKKLSQRELAKKINVDNATISKIENGITKKPSIDIIMKLSNELEISTEKLFDLSGYNFKEMFKSITSKPLKYFDKGKILNYVNKEKLDICISKDENFEYIDINKILKNYKIGKLNKKETIALITFCQTIELDNKITYLSENNDIDIEF